MSNDDWIGILIILGIIGIAGFGGVKNMQQNGANLTLEQRVNVAQNQVEDLKVKIQDMEDVKNASEYKGLVSLKYVNRNTNPEQEYVTIQVDNGAKTNISTTDWTIKSLNSGQSYNIPKATSLFFVGMVNHEENISLAPGDIVYLTTGMSPIGYSFKLNKCSGYLGQFQTFTPYINAMCPKPRDENLGSIPKTTSNDTCLDYIDSFPRCKIQTDNLHLEFTSECRRFIYDKINYGSCILTHRNDSDFYQSEWRLYLKRSQSIWKQNHEHIVLYDSVGKIVDSLSY